MFDTLNFIRANYCPGWHCDPVWCQAALLLGLCHSSKNARYSGTIPTTPFPPDLYGIGVHDTGNLVVDDYRACIDSCGLWLRTDVPFWEIGSRDWARTDRFVAEANRAGRVLGRPVKLILCVRGWTDSLGDRNVVVPMTPDMPQAKRDISARALCKMLAARVRGRVEYIELWNEPDNSHYVEGFHLRKDSPQNFWQTQEFFEAFTSHLTACKQGIRDGAAGGPPYVAFSPFMSLAQNRFSVIEKVWRATHEGMDAFSIHMYDDDGYEVVPWAQKMAKVLAGRPVLVTEHGSQHHENQTVSWYRQQAWGFKIGFGNSLRAVLNYVYDEPSSKFEMRGRDLFRGVTH